MYCEIMTNFTDRSYTNDIFNTKTPTRLAQHTYITLKDFFLTAILLHVRIADVAYLVRVRMCN